VVHQFARAREEHALDIRDPHFASFTDAERRHDEEYVDKIQGRIQKSDTQNDRELYTLSSAFEYTAAERINSGAWFGPDMKAQLTSQYDDLRNGIDLYVESNTSESTPLGLSVDLTFSRRSEDLSHKLQSIQSFHLDRGTLAELRYYKPLGKNDSIVAAPLTNLPKVVVAMTRDRALNAITLLAKKPEDRDSVTGLIMLFQIERQLAAFARYSRALGKSKKRAAFEDAAEQYESALARVRALTDEKLRALQIDRQVMTAYALQDPTTNIVIENLNNLVESVGG